MCDFIPMVFNSDIHQFSKTLVINQIMLYSSLVNAIFNGKILDLTDEHDRFNC